MICTPENMHFCMRITERQLLQLAAVIEAGGVTEGAALIGLSQPAVSRTISELERRLGEPLFRKGRRPLEPTALGRALGLQGRVILNATRKASETVASFRAGGAGTVRLGGVPFFMDAVISSMIATFNQIEPGVRIDQSYGYFPDFAAALTTDQMDMAICPMGVLEPGSGLEFEELLPARNIIACREGHPLLRIQKPTASALLEYPWIAPQPGSPLLGDLHAMLLSIGMSEVSIRYSGGSLLAAMTYLAETDALTILPHSVVFAFRRERRVTVLPYEITQPKRALGILRSTSTEPLPAALAFSRFVIAQFRSLRHLIKRHENSVVWGG